MQQRWSCCDQSSSGILLVVDPDIPDSEMLFGHVGTSGLLYTRSPTFWYVSWPTVLRTYVIGLTVLFSHGISPIKEKHCNTIGYGMYIVL